ncbi:S-layer homology domain-containing protein [Fodinisporobacter ferrooxydans]|uniref:S-layer homology domain-containing protein n=1 Tax=Fodinisporobacter ferrooxydans TaxID=2901836 RepID=A0ABY4CQ20_9BACL|nr:S-layer homology domain-containing protein [Alicyclobacillaceae bacterium MYW30-H2]
MAKRTRFRVISNCFLFIFSIAQISFGFSATIFADTTTLQQQVEQQLPISAAAYTQEAGSSDNWTPVERYLANLKPTSDYNSIVANAVYQTTVSANTYVDTYPTSLTALETTILGVTSAGEDATDVNGVNLVEKLYQQSPDVEGTFNTNVMYDLIALDAKPYNVPGNAATTRQDLTQDILSSQLPSGGWGSLTFHNGQWDAVQYDAYWQPTYITPTDPTFDSYFDTDSTGMALTALAPYYTSDANVKAAVDKAVQRLEKEGDTSNSDSLAQMIIGLSSVGVDPTNVNNVNLVQKLLAFATSNGLFIYDNSYGANAFSTKDAIGAMAAYLKFVNNSNTYESIYYHMNGPGTESDPVITTTGANGSTSGQTNGKATVSVIGYQGQTLLSSSTVALQADDNPYTVLIRAIGASNVISTGSGTSLYVKSIDGLSEFDKGPLSGWMYTVNGQFTNTGAGNYPLKDGDSVQWVYTSNGGTDVGAPASSGGVADTTSSAAPSSAVTAAIENLQLPIDNTKPIDQVGQAVQVENADQPMTAADIQNLKQTLAANQVNLSQVVSPNQDQTLSDSAKEVQLYIPQNALGSQTTIGIQKETAVSDQKGLLSPIYDFTPNGTHFDKPIAITIKAPLDVKDLSQVALVWLDESTHQWVPIPAVVDAKTGEVTGEVNHFTKFAVIDRSRLNPSAPVDHGIQGASQALLNSGEISDWGAFALARAGKSLPASYLIHVQQLLAQNHGSFHNVTDYERMALGILAAGGDPLSIDGYNLIQGIYNSTRLTSQGANGVIFALIALDSNHYQIPQNARWNRDQLIQWLLQNQNTDGGWSLIKGDASDLDLTSMALVALSPYQTQTDVKHATNAALQWITKSGNTGGISSSESIAQEIQGLAALGLNPADAAYDRSGMNLLQDLLQFQQADGGFAHQAGLGSDTIATEQALAALDAYNNFVQGKGSIYQFAAQSGTGYIDSDQISPWALDSVAKASQYHLMQGIGTTAPMFAPKQLITRAEFTKVIMSLLGVKPEAGQQAIFADVKPGSWYYGYVKAAKDQGLIQGISASRFAPEQPITREQMAVIIANAWKLQPIRATFDVTDRNQVDRYAYASMQALYDHGIMVGSGGAIDPQGNATREMAAVLAVKLYEDKQK